MIHIRKRSMRSVRWGFFSRHAVHRFGLYLDRRNWWTTGVVREIPWDLINYQEGRIF